MDSKHGKTSALQVKSAKCRLKQDAIFHSSDWLKM